MKTYSAFKRRKILNTSPCLPRFFIQSLYRKIILFMKKILTLFALTLGLTGLSLAQTNTVTGTVTDCMGTPVAGVNVYVVTDSTTTGGVGYYNMVTTNAAGVYTDNVPYSTFYSGVQPIHIYIYDPYTWVSYTFTENPASAG